MIPEAELHSAGQTGRLPLREARSRAVIHAKATRREKIYAVAGDTLDTGGVGM